MPTEPSRGAADGHDPAALRTRTDFAETLTSLRESAGLTVRDVAKASGLPNSTLGGYFAGRHLPSLKPANQLPGLLRALGVCDPVLLDRWRLALRRVRHTPGTRSPDTFVPYRGLASFQPEHAQWFYGREQLTELLVEQLVGESTSATLAVVGPSGSGKSSLLRAGLIPALAAREQDDRDAHSAPVVLFTPGSRPLKALAHALAPITDSNDGDMIAVLAADSFRGLPVPHRLTIVVDQFEEIFTQCSDESERQQFIGIMCSIASLLRSGTADRVIVDGTAVVLGMRADFYAQALRYEKLAHALQSAQLIVGPMSDEELRRAIVEPARQAGFDIDPGLVELLLRDLGRHGNNPDLEPRNDAGALPLLSHALLATWERGRHGTMTIANYREAGGIHGAVAHTAEQVFISLTGPEQHFARRLFVRLVHLADDAADTRRRIPVAEILDGRTDPEADAFQEVVDRFIAARLLTVDKDTIEITHEVLLRVWPQLREWLNGDRDWLNRHRSLGNAAEQWREASRDPDLLYRGGTLQIMRECVEDRGYRSELNAVESEFFNASVRQAADEAARERRRMRRRYRFVALLTVLAILAASAALYARQLQLTDERGQTQALSRLVANEADRLSGNDVSLSMQLALAAYRIAPTPEALSSLLDSTGVTPDTQVRPSSDAESIAVSGSLLAAGTASGTVQIWTFAKNGVMPIGKPLAGANGAVLSLTFSGDGRTLAAGGTDGRVHLWDTSDPAQPRALGALAGPGGEIMSVAMSSDGRRLAVGTSDAKVRLWDASDPAHPVPAPPLTGPTETVESLAFTPSGHTLAAGSDDSTVHLWQVTDPGHPSALSTLSVPNNNVIFSIAISPDGLTLAAGTSEGHNVHLWDITDPARPTSTGPPLTGPASWVNSVAFSPDGRTLAAGSSDGQLWLFDLGSRQPIRELPHPNPVSTVRYLSDGTPVTVTVDDGTIRWWRLPGPVIIGARDAIFAVSFDANGHRLGISPGASDNTLTVWDATDTQHPIELGPPLVGSPGRRRFSGSGALTPDGRTFAGGDVDGTIQLWDISNPAHPARLGTPLHAGTKLIEWVTISQHGDLLAVSSDDGTVRLYDISDPRHPVSLAAIATPESGKIYQAVFSPDEHLLAAASDDHDAYLYDISHRTRPTLLATLGGFTSSAYSAAFSHSGRALAIGSADGTVRLWDVTNPRHPTTLGRQLSGPIGYIYSMAFAPARDVLAISGNEDGTIWLWDLTNPQQPAHLATLTGPAKGTVAVSFSPDGRTLAAGGMNHTVQLWNTSPRTAAAWICSVVGQSITRHEWDQYIPSRPYAPPCP